jgi:hypothetical protein
MPPVHGMDRLHKESPPPERNTLGTLLPFCYKWRRPLDDEKKRRYSFMQRLGRTVSELIKILKEENLI